MACTYNMKRPQKAQMGLQRVAPPPEYGIGEQLGAITGLAGQGAQLGMAVGGPVGMGIGAGVGLLGGIVGNQLKANQINQLREQAMAENMRRQDIERSLFGNEPTQITTPLYAEGTQVLGISKPIEIERNEILWGRNPQTNKIYLIQDYKKAPTHRKGGKVIQAEAGQFISPADKREDFLRAWESRDQAKLERLRLELPEDREASKDVVNSLTNNNQSMTARYQPVEKAKNGKRFRVRKYQNGTDYLNPPTPIELGLNVLSPVNTFNSLFTQPEYNSTGMDINAAGRTPQFNTMRIPVEPSPLTNLSPVLSNQPSLLANETLPVDSQMGQTINPTNVGLGVLTQLPNIYNTARGFLERPQVNQPIISRPEEQRFIDRYNPQRRQVLEQERLALAQAAQTSGGNSAISGANQAIINARSAGQRNLIEQQAANEALGIDAANLNLRNQFVQQRDAEMRRITDINDQNKAAQTRFQTQAMTGIGQNAADTIRNRQLQQRDVRQEQVQKDYLQQLAQRDVQSAYLQLVDRPDFVQYLTDEDISSIFGNRPDLVNSIRSMRDRFRTQSSTRTTLPIGIAAPQTLGLGI